MGACATKLSGDQKVKGEPPLVVEDGVAPPMAEGEKANKADGVPAAAETTDPADVSRRRSLSDLLKEVSGFLTTRIFDALLRSAELWRECYVLYKLKHLRTGRRGE
jgi:hypothetical protein